MKEFKPYLSPTELIDSDHPEIAAFSQKVASNEKSEIAVACKLFNVVRDKISYNPYTYFYKRSHYKASNVLKQKNGYCVSKACLLCALGRAAGIPTRLGLADIRNHGASQDIIDMMGTDIFTYHGYVEFFLNGKWIKATPAFDRPVYKKHRIPVLTFDGQQDAVFPARNLDGNPYVEYLKYHGTYADLPFDDIVKGFRSVYGDERVDLWIQMLESELENN